MVSAGGAATTPPTTPKGKSKKKVTSEEQQTTSTSNSSPSPRKPITQRLAPRSSRKAVSSFVKSLKDAAITSRNDLSSPRERKEQGRADVDKISTEAKPDTTSAESLLLPSLSGESLGHARSKSMDDPVGDSKEIKAELPLFHRRSKSDWQVGSPDSFFRSIGERLRPDDKVPIMDKDIGLRLALPDKMDIMCGRATPPMTLGTTTGVEAEAREDIPSYLLHLSPGSPSKKKLLVLPQEKRSTPNKTPLSSIRKKLTHRPDGVEDRVAAPPLDIADDKTPIRTTSDPLKEEIVLRSSELEPSVHQVSIPPATDFLMCARVCLLMEGYDRLLQTQAQAGKRWFDFADLVGVDRIELENMYMQSIGHKSFDGLGQDSPILPSLSGNPFGPAPAPSSSPANDIEGMHVAKAKEQETSMGKITKETTNEPHPSVIKSLLECTNDIVVEGYFTETIGEEEASIPLDPRAADQHNSRVQVTVFSSQQHRQFIVCYRGTMEQQTKPVKSHVKQKDANGEPSILHPTHAVLVNPTFRDSYFTPSLEEKVFTLLDKLTTENPFCDVVYTGHSFGGALGLIGATRYAALFPMMTVKCHVFGTPKVGGTAFRHFANSLPNLKVMRIEHGADYYVHFPVGPKWDNVGHTIVLNPMQDSEIASTAKDMLAKVSSGNNPIKPSDGFIGKHNTPILAYKFDKRSSEQQSGKLGNGVHGPSTKALDPLARAKKMHGKNDHEMRSYVHALEQFTHLGVPWVTAYVGEEGGGIVRGLDHEERHLV